MSWLTDIFSPGSAQPLADSGGTPDQRMAQAKWALTFYHNYATTNFSDNYTLTFQGLLDTFTSISPTFLDNFGKTLIIAQPTLTNSDVQGAMENVARMSKGVPPGAPRDLTAFYLSLSDKLENWDWAHWGTVAQEVAVETVHDVASFGLGAVGIYLLIGVVVFSFAAGRK